MPKNMYISDLREGVEIVEFFLTSSAQIKKTKSDKEYCSMRLVDKTGEIDAKFWDPPKGFDLESIKEQTFVKVKGRVVEYQKQLQVTVQQIRDAEPGEIDPIDFFRRSERHPEEMYEELLVLLWNNLDAMDPTLKLLELMLYENHDAFTTAPAAKSVHHCFLGGLCEHVLSMAKIAVKVCEHYGLRKDLVLGACILHDIGKTRELTYDQGIGYSTEGSLVGHISIGMQMLSEACKKIPEIGARLKIELLHMVASHHGLLEYGSPKVPMMREAIAFHAIDSLDSKLELCRETLRNDRNDGEFTAYSNHLGTMLYRGTIQ